MRWVQQSKRQIAKIAQRGLDLVYPPQCVFCRAEREDAGHAVNLCAECQERLIPKVWTPCPRCGAQIDGRLSHPTKGCAICAATPLYFDTVVALGGYHTELQQVVLRTKWESGAALALALGKLLAIQRRELLENSLPNLVIPIPMFWTHRIRRHVNGPSLIARTLAQTLDIPCQNWSLVRCKKTLTQSQLPPKERFRNVRGAFRVRFAHRIRGRRILLVDDVLTTGATCSEAARVLREAGAEFVAAAVIARAQGGNR
jgi:ComF family protein